VTRREFTSVMSGNVPYGAIGSKLGVPAHRVFLLTDYRR
jgi:hypothetical protein